MNRLARIITAALTTPIWLMSLTIPTEGTAPMTGPVFEQWDYYWAGGDVECPSQEALDAEAAAENAEAAS
jgi:hypothetical protein